VSVRRRVLLDLDGTLVDRQSAFEKWARRFVEETQGDWVDLIWLIEADARGYRPRQELAVAIRERLRLEESVARLEERLQLEVIEGIECYPGVVDGLRTLRELGAELVLVTNGTVRQQRTKLERTGLDLLLDRVVISEEVGVKKPDPRIFDVALDSVGADAGTWMVGDHPAADIDGARAVGLRTAWVSHGLSWPYRWRPTLEAETTSEVLVTLTQHP